MKRIISIITTLMIVFAMMPSIVFANVSEADKGTITLDTVVNPIYEDVIENNNRTLPQVLKFRATQPSLSSDGEEDPVYCGDIEYAAEILRDNMECRKADSVVYLMIKNADIDDIEQASSDIFRIAREHTGVPTEGDYLDFVWQKMSGQIEYYFVDSTAFVTYNYNISYYTDALQEKEVDEAVNTLKNELNLSGKNNYEKIKAIYDYMTSNIEYDYENLNDDSYKLKYSAYAALIDKTAVCQGYAVLFYRLALEYGIDARVISGESNGEAHGWNIVNLGDKYYYVDATWDAGNSDYRYFLKGSEDFENHVSDSKYYESIFTSKYPIDNLNYKKSDNEDMDEDADVDIDEEHSHEWHEVVVKKTCDSDGYTYHECATCGENYTDNYVKAGHEIVYDAMVKAEVGKSGKTAGQYCKICNEVLVKPVKIPAVVKPVVISKRCTGKLIPVKVKINDTVGKTITTVTLSAKNVGTHSKTINLSGNYKGKIKVSYKIIPRGTSITKLTAAKRGFTVKWSKQSGKMTTSRITGYQYRYSTSSKMTKPVTKTVKGYSTTSAKRTSLKAKKTYYVQVRTYKTVKGVNYYSSWSKVKRVRTR